MRGHRGESDFLDISGSAARVRPNFQEKFKWPDRKSTRLNSSHDQISYAVFCLKKKKTCALEIHRLRTLMDSSNCQITYAVFSLPISRKALHLLGQPPATRWAVSRHMCLQAQVAC